MTSEVVKYHNDLNTVIMRTWTAEEMNFFFAILTKAKEQGLKKLVFDTDELKLLASSSRKYRWEETITTAVKKIGQLTYFEQSERKFRVMTLFEIFEVDLEKRTIEVKVSANFDYILNKLETQFTRYELEEFTSIRSTYAKTMYRLLKQWRTLGQKEFSVEDLKRILDTPKTYRPSEIDRLVLKPILSQLSLILTISKLKKSSQTSEAIQFWGMNSLGNQKNLNRMIQINSISQNKSRKASQTCLLGRMLIT